MEFIDQLIAFIQSSYFYRSIAWLLHPAWNDAIGRTIILTATGYFVAFSLFSGYFSRFARGFSGLSAQQMGFHWSDVITLLPNGILTITKLIRESHKYLKGLVIGLLIFITSLFLGSVFANLFIRYIGTIPHEYTEPIFALGLASYVLMSLLGLLDIQIPYLKKFPRLQSLIFQTIGIFFFGLSILSTNDPSVLTQTNQAIINSIWYREPLVLMIAIIALLLPLTVGMKIAEDAIIDQLLSRVTYLTLQQPISSLASYQQKPEDENEPPPTVTWIQRWFTKPSQQIVAEPDVYDYRIHDDQYLYLVASLPRNIVLFESGPQEDPLNGRLILINRDIVHAMELSRPRKPDRENEENTANQ